MMSPLNGDVKMSPLETGDIHLGSEGTAKALTVINACIKGDMACASAAGLLCLSVCQIKRFKERMGEDREMKELIPAMEAETRVKGERRITPKTIANYYLIAAGVFATAKDGKSEQLFPRQWDLNHIGLPEVDNVQWRRDCAAKIGLGFTLPAEEEQPLMDKSGEVFEDEGHEEVAAQVYMRAGMSDPTHR